MIKHTYSQTPQNHHNQSRLSLPILRLLQKDKKHHYNQKENHNALKVDIDHVISSLTTKQPSYHLAQTQKGNKKIQ